MSISVVGSVILCFNNSTMMPLTKAGWKEVNGLTKNWENPSQICKSWGAGSGAVEMTKETLISAPEVLILPTTSLLISRLLYQHNSAQVIIRMQHWPLRQIVLPRRRDQGRSRGHDGPLRGVWPGEAEPLVWLEEQAEVGRGWGGRGQVKVMSDRAEKWLIIFKLFLSLNGCRALIS